MSPHLLKKFILSDKNSVSGGVALITFVGLPGCKKSSQCVLQKMLQKEFGIRREELMKVAEVTEEENGFCIYELGAVRESKETWQWYRFTNRSRYLSCFVSSLQKDTKPEMFAEQACKQDMFEDEALDSCFYNIYQLLSALYNDKSESAIPVKELSSDDAILSLINVWDIGFNGAIIHFLTLLGGYLHHNFPILFLGHPDDISCETDHLAECLNIDQYSGRAQVAGLKPIFKKLSRAEFLLTFSHLARSYDRNRREVCRVAVIDNHKETSLTDDEEHQKQLGRKIMKEAEKLKADNLLCPYPWIITIDDEEKYVDKFKQKVSKLLDSERQRDVPLSWFFLRSAFYKTGQLFIKTAELRKCAQKCMITDDDFARFLKRFTGFGSIIHIPNIPVLCEYVILNPPDFFHKLTELYYPRFNGDLKYGIASFSTLRRLFGENLQFFCDVLTSSNLAVEINSDRVVFVDTERKEHRRLPIAEKCLYIPSIRTEVLESDKNASGFSMLLVYKKAHLPTHTTEDVVKYLVQKDLYWYLVTSEYYNITQFQCYYQPTTQQVAESTAPAKPLISLTIISHGNKNELLIQESETVESKTTESETAESKTMESKTMESKTMKKKEIKDAIADIKKELIRAYCSAREIYSEHHYKLLGVEPELEFAISCSDERSKYHNITTDDQPCESCRENEKFMNVWKYGKTHWM